MSIEKWSLPVGRCVGGHPSKPQVKTNFQTKQPVMKDGQQVTEHRCNIAWPKDVFMAQIWPNLQAVAARIYPNGVPQNFAWKIIDGDSSACAKGTNIPYNKKDGYPGHYILKISTEAFPPRIVKFENGAYRDVHPDEFKTGYFLVPNVDVKAHANNDGGLYINPNMYEMVAYGAEIVSQGADPTQLFGGQQHALPPGASAMPASGAPVGSMPVGQPGQAPGGYPAQAPAGAPGGAPMGYPQQPAPQPAMAPAQPTAPVGYAQQPATPAMAYPSNAPAQAPAGPQPHTQFVANAMGQPAAAPAGYPGAPVGR